MDRGAQQATVHGVANSWTRLSDFQFFILLQVSPVSWATDCYQSMVCQEPACTAGGERQASEVSPVFKATLHHQHCHLSASSQLSGGIRFSWECEPQCELSRVRDLGCTLLMTYENHLEIILPIPANPWKNCPLCNCFLVPKMFETAALVPLYCCNKNHILIGL